MWFKSIRSRIWRLIRTSIRLSFYLFVLTSPVTLLPVINSLYDGISLTFWSNHRIAENTNAWIFEVEQHQRLSYWNVPGAMSIHEFMDSKEPFYITALRTMDWTTKLGFIMPNSQTDSMLEAPIDHQVRIAGLVRDARHNEKARAVWVYVTLGPWWRRDPWDKAFEELLQTRHVKPFNTPDIYYVDCGKSQLMCGVWGVKYPSLVHFSISNATVAELDTNTDEADNQHAWYTYSQPRSQLHPITARVIELPLEDDAAVAFLPRNTLPTAALQLRTLLRDAPTSAILEHFEPFHDQVQMLRRFSEHLEDKCSAARRNTCYYMGEAETWWTKHVIDPVFGKQFDKEILQWVRVIAFLSANAISQLIWIPFAACWGLYTWYAGLTWGGEPVGTHVMYDESPGNAPPNMFDDMMAGFWDFAAQKMASGSAESAATAAVTEPAS
jgi:hypothetical protein